LDVQIKVWFSFQKINVDIENKHLVFKLTATFPSAKDRSPDAGVLEKDYGVLHHRVKVN